jgi:hypothetical protein
LHVAALLWRFLLPIATVSGLLAGLPGPLPAFTATGAPLGQVILSSSRFGQPLLSAPALSCAAPVPQRALSLQFEDGIRLTGYDLVSATPAGGYALLSLYWRTQAPPSADYKVFVHFLDSKRQVVAQDDGYPVNGASRTVDWQAGELVRDTHFVNLESDLAPGTYQIEVGLYEESTGKRLQLLLEENTLSPDAPLLPDPAQVLPPVARPKWTSH